MRFWLLKTLCVALTLVVALVLGAWLGASGWWVALTLAGWLLFEWWSAARVARQVDRGQWPPLEGLAAVRRLLRAGRGRLRRARLRSRRLTAALHGFREAAGALPDGTLVLDAQGQLLWFNKQARRLLSLRYPSDLGRVFQHLVRHPRLSQWLAEGGPEPLADLPAPADDNVRLSFRLAAYGNLRLLVIRDVSKLMKLEQVRRDFVANVSHELRTPLTVVNGYLDAIDDDEIPELAPVLRQMRAQSQRMVQLVEDLLTLSRLDADEGATDEIIDLPTLIKQLKRDGEALSRGQHRFTLDTPLAAQVRGSLKDLRSAFGNLVSNAVRYSPDGGQITLRWAPHPLTGGGAFSVCDEGLGIPPEHLPRLTERFYRVSSSRSRETGGTGLGLAIVKHVLLHHQGFLEIQSTLGRGSCFTAVLPRERLLPALQLAAEAAPVTP